jgi:FHS family L-fucose permease-like MFS transporter
MHNVIASAKRPAEERRPPVFPVGHVLPFVLVTVLFFIWGMSNNLTDILVQ